MQREDKSSVKKLDQMKKFEKLSTAPGNMDASLTDVGTDKPEAERETQAASVSVFFPFFEPPCK